MYCFAGRLGILAGLAKRGASLWTKMKKESIQEMETIIGNRGVEKHRSGTKGENRKGRRPAGALNKGRKKQQEGILQVH